MRQSLDDEIIITKYLLKHIKVLLSYLKSIKSAIFHIMHSPLTSK